MVERGEIGRSAYNVHAVGDDFFGQSGTLVRDVLDDAEPDASRLVDIRSRGALHE